MNAANRSDAFKLARTRRERGIVSSILHADDDAPGWADRAYAYLIRYAATQARAFTIEDFRLWALDHGLDEPPELRAFGGITQRAIRNGVIARVGFAPTAASNGSHRGVYVAAMDQPQLPFHR
jgi:hypothetical protein